MDSPMIEMRESGEMMMRLLRWREKHLPENTLVIMLAFIVGVCCSLVAALLKGIIHLLQTLVTNINLWGDLYFSYLIFPVIGVLLTGLFVRYVVKDNIGHGVTKILFALSQRKSRIKPHNMWTSVVASSMTIGLGGSVGAEAPIVLTGSAIGNNIGRFFRLEQRNLILLMGCGAAGAVAGIFKAPITGLIFVIEVLLMDLTLTSVVPLLISSVTAATMSYFFFGVEPMFQYGGENVFTITRIPFVLILGVGCGLMSVYFTKVSFSLEQWFKSLSNFWSRFAISAVLLSTLIFVFPPLYGEGYLTITKLVSGNGMEALTGSLFERIGDRGWVVPLFLVLAMMTKIVATVATNSGGGCGGVFAPSLFVGALLGFIFSLIVNDYLGAGNHIVSHDNFTLLGMAGLMAGVMHAPLTGTFLIAELTGGYNLFLPLLVVSMTAYGTTRLFLRHNIYALRLAEQGTLVTHQKDKAVLTLLQMTNLIETDFIVLRPDMTLGDTVKLFSSSTSSRNIFPVIGDDGHMVGMVLLDNIRNIMFRPELYERFKVSKFMVVPSARIRTDMSMDSVMGVFEDNGAWNLPVESPEGEYLGFLSKSAIFNAYREVLNGYFSGD